jgi:hypothetical protein
VAGPNRGSRQLPPELLERAPHLGRRRVLDGDQDRIRGGAAEVALEREESPFRHEIVGEGADPRVADADPEQRDRGGQEERDRDREADRRAAQDTVDEGPPEAAFGLAPRQRSAADHR